MYGRTNTLRFLSLTLMTGLFGLIVGDLSEAAEKKENSDSAKKKAVATARVVAETAGAKLGQAALSRPLFA